MLVLVAIFLPHDGVAFGDEERKLEEERDNELLLLIDFSSRLRLTLLRTLLLLLADEFLRAGGRCVSCCFRGNGDGG